MASDNNVVLKINGLHKSFNLPIEASNGIKRAFINLTKGVRGYKEQQVIRGVSFDVKKGDFIGIVGKNGSGKSTLLKLISGIYSPDKGSIDAYGSMVSFIELGVGFDSELTGRENVYLNGALLGFSNSEMDAVYDNIVDFAELHEFMNQKLKNYSSGMQVRLAFAIAIQAEGDILVLDEVLAVGDEAFQRKCNEYFEKIRHDKSKTVILVTHGMENVRKYCNRAILIADGKIKNQGSPDDVASQYSLDNLDSTESAQEEDNCTIKIKSISSKLIKSGEDIKFEVEYNSDDNTPLFVGVSIWSGDTHLFSDSTKKRSTNTRGVHSFKYTYNTSGLGNGTIKVTASLYNNQTGDLVAYAHEGVASYYKIRHDDKSGLLLKKGEWL